MDFKKLEIVPLSNEDIYKMTKCRNLIMYPNLSKYTSIDDCFNGSDMFILFFELSEGGVGHWECCFKNGKTINFFDSYGLAVDECEKYISLKTRESLKENTPYLTDLMDKADDDGYSCIYSTQKYQLFDGVETCGRHVSIRLRNYTMNNEEYYNYLVNIKNVNKLNTFDDVVTFLTYNLINK